MTRSRRSSCPISFALDIFGDKWSLLVLRDLIFKEKIYYEEFIRSDEKISTNILAERLKRLKDEGLIRGAAKTNAKSSIRQPPKPWILSR